MSLRVCVVSNSYKHSQSLLPTFVFQWQLKIKPTSGKSFKHVFASDKSLQTCHSRAQDIRLAAVQRSNQSFLQLREVKYYT